MTEQEEEEEARDSLKINRGNMVVIDSDTLSPVLIVRCTGFDMMPADLRDNFNKNISQSYLHARARNQCDKHCSVAPLEEAGEYWGWMGCCGWRGGSEAGRSLGEFSFVNQ